MPESRWRQRVWEGEGRLRLSGHERFGVNAGSRVSNGRRSIPASGSGDVSSAMERGDNEGRNNIPVSM